MSAGASRLARALVIGRRRPFVEAIRDFLDADDRVDASTVVLEGEDASQLGSSLAPEVAVLECPGGAEQEQALVAAVAGAFPHARLVVVCSAPHGDLRGSPPRGATRLGPAHGNADLLEAVVAPSSQGPRRRAHLPSQRATPLSPLSEREVHVLSLLVGGCSLAEVAERLEISPHTVRTHVQNVMAKLGARSRVEMINLGRSAGLRPASSGARR